MTMHTTSLDHWLIVSSCRNNIYALTMANRAVGAVMALTAAGLGIFLQSQPDDVADILATSYASLVESLDALTGTLESFDDPVGPFGSVPTVRDTLVVIVDFIRRVITADPTGFDEVLDDLSVYIIKCFYTLMEIWKIAFDFLYIAHKMVHQLLNDNIDGWYKAKAALVLLDVALVGMALVPIFYFRAILRRGGR